MKSLKRFILPEAPRILVGATIGGLSSAMAVGLLACSAWLISMASLRPPIMVLEVAIVSVRFFGLSRGVLRYAARIIEHNSALRTLTKIRVGLYLKLEGQLPQYFAILRRGEVLRRMVADSELLMDLWLRIGNPWIGALVSGTAGLGIIFTLAPHLGITLAAIFIVALFLIPLVAVGFSANEGQRREEERIFDAIIQASDSVQESLIFGYQKAVRGEIAGAQRLLNRIDVKSGLASGLAIFLQYLATGLSVVIAAISSVALFHEKSLAGVNVAVVLLLPLVIFDGFTGLPAAFSRLATILNSARSVDALLSELEVVEGLSPIKEPANGLVEFSSAIPLLPKVKIKPYSGRAEIGRPLVISGKSGAGKSSLLHALIGFLDFRGTITIGGQSAAEISSEDRIEKFAILLQQDHLFATSIRENLKIGNPSANDEEIMATLELVEMSELISKVGLDTHIGAYGHNFSGGERQRLKLARTLLRNRPYVLLDEPFEYLDAEQAQRIASRVSNYCKGKTLIVISHLAIDLS